MNRYTPTFYRLLHLAVPSLREFRRHSTRNFFSKTFSRKKVKNILDWNGMVSCISLSMKRIVESRLNNSGRGKTERDVSLSCAFYRSYFVSSIYLSLYSIRPFYLNSFIFNFALKNKQLTGITCNCWITLYPYPH